MESTDEASSSNGSIVDSSFAPIPSTTTSSSPRSEPTTSSSGTDNTPASSSDSQAMLSGETGKMTPAESLELMDSDQIESQSLASVAEPATIDCDCGTSHSSHSPPASATLTPAAEKSSRSLESPEVEVRTAVKRPSIPPVESLTTESGESHASSSPVVSETPSTKSKKPPSGSKTLNNTTGNYAVGKYPMDLLVRDAFVVMEAPKPVCTYCLDNKFEPENDPVILKCSGECMKRFHVQCLKQNGHDNVDTSENFKCPECASGARVCFSCKESGTDLVKCPEKDCGHFYHLACLMVSGKNGSPSPAEKLQPCPLHHCHTCTRLGRDSKTKEMDKGSLAKCNYCPTAYHFHYMCFPAETTICPENAKVMTCFKHRDISKILVKGKKSRQPWRKSIMNPRICFFCKKGGKLLVCETCPFTADLECAGLDAVPEGPWKCADCTKGAKPMLLDIVWYKAPRYRVWPCQILPEQMVPENVMRQLPPGCGFVMRYLGTQEYAFAVSSEVLPYEIYDPKWKHRPEKDKGFAEGLKEATDLCRQILTLKTGILVKHFAGKRPVYHRIKSNKPIPPVKYITSVKKEDAHICECKSTDPDPCGPTSNCLNRDIQYECSYKHCPTGGLCKNQRIGKRDYPKMEIFYTANRGWALRTLQDVKKGDLVIEYVGEIITVEERNRRIKEKLATGDANFYFLDLTNARVIDAGPAGNLARFANHSCDANSFSQKWIVDGDTHIGLIATRDIPSGAEITFDYRWEYESGVTSRECLCGADNCPGMIGGKTYDPAVGKQLPTVTKKAKRSSISPGRKRPRKSSVAAKKLKISPEPPGSDVSTASLVVPPTAARKKRGRDSIAQTASPLTAVTASTNKRPRNASTDLVSPNPVAVPVAAVEDNGTLSTTGPAEGLVVLGSQ